MYARKPHYIYDLIMTLILRECTQRLTMFSKASILLESARSDRNKLNSQFNNLEQGEEKSNVEDMLEDNSSVVAFHRCAKICGMPWKKHHMLNIVCSFMIFNRMLPASSTTMWFTFYSLIGCL